MMHIIRHFIDGEFRSTSSLEPDSNPSNRAEIIAECSLGTSADINDAVAAALGAHPAWANAFPLERARLLDAIGSKLIEHKAELGSLLAREEGKLQADAVAEAAKAGWIFKFYAGAALQLLGESGSRMNGAADVLVSREPLGVIGLVTPFNAPLVITAWKAAPALACGNTVVLKPSELAPASVDLMTRLIAEAGLPRGVFNVVYGHGGVVGQALAAHRDVAGVSFTGGEVSGGRVAGATIPRLAKLQLELGGKNAFVIADDADPAAAARLAIAGAFHGAGQRCTATSRIIVMSRIYEDALAALVSETQAIRVGAALDPSAVIGPLTTSRQVDNCATVIRGAIAEGARVIANGHIEADREAGNFVAPCLLADTAASMSVNQQEIFGPVASVIRVRDIDEAITVANDTRFGLSAGIATRSISLSRRFRREVKAGVIAVNQATSGVDLNAPFAGMRASSYGGAEQGLDALQFYSITKTAYIADG
jgi:alpha-ketoglutaric semialdehyde dehydrogenase